MFGSCWRDCFLAHWTHTVFVLVWIGVLIWWSPALLPWMVLVFLGPFLTIPFSRLAALKSLAQRARERGWFLVPEERTTPPELQDLAGRLPGQGNQFFLAKRYAEDYGILQAILDPYINSIHVSLLRQRETVPLRTREYLGALGERLLQNGPGALSVQEKNALLLDADSMMTLHRKLRRSPAADLHEWWQMAFRRYNESLDLFVWRTVSSFE